MKYTCKNRDLFVGKPYYYGIHTANTIPIILKKSAVGKIMVWEEFKIIEKQRTLVLVFGYKTIFKTVNIWPIVVDSFNVIRLLKHPYPFKKTNDTHCSHIWHANEYVWSSENEPMIYTFTSHSILCLARAIESHLWRNLATGVILENIISTLAYQERNEMKTLYKISRSFIIHYFLGNKNIFKYVPIQYFRQPREKRWSENDLLLVNACKEMDAEKYCFICNFYGYERCEELRNIKLNAYSTLYH